MKHSLFTTILVSMITTLVYAQSSAPTDLPDFSVIGNFLGTSTESKTSFDVKEIEVSYQSYLYPSVKADVFTAFHKEESGAVAIGLEEAYVTFSDLFGVLVPNYSYNLGLGAVVGKKRVGFGKLNTLHPEQWLYVDRPIATQQLVGGGEGLAAEGAQLNYLLPLPFFSQVEVGLWTVAAHHDHEEGEEEGEEEEHSGVEYENKLFNARVWNGFELSRAQELELGLNYLIGNVTADTADDKVDMLGLDVTYSLDLNLDRYLLLKAEAYQATYGHEGEARADQLGGFVLGNLKLNNYYQTGFRYSYLGKLGDEGSSQTQLSLMLTRQLTETSKFRVQYNINENSENMIAGQFVFGVGPHSHVLQ